MNLAQDAQAYEASIASTRWGGRSSSSERCEETEYP